MRLITGAATDVGRVREGNEDAYLVDDAMGLVAVADGMGGHRGGEVASATALEALRAAITHGRPLRESMEDANEAVFTKSLTDDELRGMGTTLTAATLVTGGTVLVGHVGDSRAYLLHDGVLRQLTVDHSLVEELVREGRLTADEAAVHPQRSIITRALGVDPSVEVDVYSVELAPGDRLLLCSDGLTGMVQAEIIAGTLRREEDPARAAAALIDAANVAGGEDNITAVVVAVTDDPPLRARSPNRSTRSRPRSWRKHPRRSPASAAGIAPVGSAACCCGRSRSSSCSASRWARSAGTHGAATTSTCSRVESPCSRGCPAVSPVGTRPSNGAPRSPPISSGPPTSPR